MLQQIGQNIPAQVDCGQRLNEISVCHVVSVERRPNILESFSLSMNPKACIHIIYIYITSCCIVTQNNTLRFCCVHIGLSLFINIWPIFTKSRTLYSLEEHDREVAAAYFRKRNLASLVVMQHKGNMDFQITNCRFSLF